MCRVLGVSRSGYYAWRDRPPSKRTVEDVELAAELRETHAESRGTYGTPRLHAELQARGRRVGQKRVWRLKRREGLEGVSHRLRGPKPTKRSNDARPVPDLVERNFRVDAPDRMWVADITYIPTWAGFLYLAVVVDAWSRRVVGWEEVLDSRGEGGD